MKIIINESQLNRLFSEQDSGFSRFLDRKHSDVETSAKFNREIIDFYKKYNHQINMVASIGLSLIPIVGPLISTSISLADAKQYYDEGDKKTAGLVGMFSMIPFIGPVLAKIPGVKELGVKGMAAIASKLGKGQKLSSSEQNIVLLVSNNQKLIQSEIPKKFAKKTISQKVVQGTTKVGKVVAPYAAAGYGYDKAYDYVKRNTPKTKAEKENVDWDFVKESFGSSGSKEDNILLNNAWNSGWRPGNVVPKQFQTALYQKNYNEEESNLKSLESLIASNKK
jgi:hypothetical protein